MNSIENVHKEDWIEIKHICCYHHMKKTNFAYNTSGSICAFYIEKVDDTVHFFTCIDLVNKISFDSRIVYKCIEDEDILKVDGFYFCSENELVIVSAFDKLVKQMVYKIDFANQSIKLQETITHKFISRDVLKWYDFSFQPNKFVNFNGIDYILLIADDSENDDSVKTYGMYLIPMNPKDKDAPTKEFMFRFKPDNQITARIKEIMEPYVDLNEIANAVYVERLDCLVRANKLCFNFSDLSTYTNDDCYRLIGVYGEVDLTKLRDISQEEFRSKENLRLLFEEQDAFQFIDAGDVHVALLDSVDYDIYFHHFDYNIGTVYMYRKKDNNILHMTVINHMGASKTSVMDCELEAVVDESSRNYNRCDRFTIHPHGALLHFKIEKGSIRFRVLKNLKMNLMSLSLNKVLFHKDTPIKNHPAYRLCFNRTKPVEYDIKKKKNLKRKRRS